MAENEELDLGSARSRRWEPVRRAIREGATADRVAALSMKALFEGLRKSLKEFEEAYGITLPDFLADRHQPAKLDKLLVRTRRHSYAALLVEILKAYPEARPADVYARWFRSVINSVLDQVIVRAKDTAVLPNLHDAESLRRDIFERLGSRIESEASKLSSDPSWRPVARRKKGEPKPDATSGLLSVSLIGRAD